MATQRLIPVAVAVTGIFLAWIGVHWFERLNLYAPHRQLSVLPATYGLSYEEVRFDAEDGVRLHGWFIPAQSSQAPVLVFFHGNGGNISDRIDKLRIFHAQDLGVFLFDYRGYGRSQGSPSEEGTYRDGRAAVGFLSGKGLPADRLVYYGESLGAAVALETALHHPPRALVLDSAFTSTVDMGRLVYPWLPVHWLIRYRYDNIGKIRGLRCPLLVLHSPQDDIVPYAMGRTLFEAAPEPKEFFETRGSHNGGFLETPGYGERIAEFLKKRA